MIERTTDEIVDEIFDNSHDEPLTKICPLCGDEFFPTHGRQKFCLSCKEKKKAGKNDGPKNRKEPEPAPSESGTLLCMDDAMDAFVALSADVASLAARMRTSEQAVLVILGDLAAVKDKIKGRTKA